MLLKRELKLVASDHSLLLTLLIAPLLYAFFYGSIYSFQEEKDVKIAVVDDDDSGLSRQLIYQINQLPVAEVVKTANISLARQNMYRGEVQGFLLLPQGMEEKVMALQPAHAVLSVNASRFLPSSDLMMAINQTMLAVGAGVRLKYFQTEGLTHNEAMQEVMPVQLDFRSLFNERSSYGGFLLPGLLALILQQTLLLGLAESIALEKGNKKLGEALQLAGGSPSLLLWGKGLFYFVLFCCYAFFFAVVNFDILGIPIRGSAVDLGIAMVLFLLTLIPMSAWLGALFPNQLMAILLLAFSTYPIFLITGYVWPYDSLPLPIQWLSALLPTTPFISIYRAVVQFGAPLSDYLGELAHLAALWLFYSGLFMWKVKRLPGPKSVLLT